MKKIIVLLALGLLVSLTFTVLNGYRIAHLESLIEAQKETMDTQIKWNAKQGLLNKELVYQNCKILDKLEKVPKEKSNCGLIRNF